MRTSPGALATCNNGARRSAVRHEALAGQRLGGIELIEMLDNHRSEMRPIIG